MTFNDVMTCPKCNKETLNVCGSTREPFTSGECWSCGYNFYPREEQYDLVVLNEIREEQGLKPLKKLPKIDLEG